jgi:hypothetical protein
MSLRLRRPGRGRLLQLPLREEMSTVGFDTEGADALAGAFGVTAAKQNLDAAQRDTA